MRILYKVPERHCRTDHEECHIYSSLTTLNDENSGSKKTIQNPCDVVLRKSVSNDSEKFTTNVSTALSNPETCENKVTGLDVNLTSEFIDIQHFIELLNYNHQNIISFGLADFKIAHNFRC